jgi:agmatine deiminase
LIYNSYSEFILQVAAHQKVCINVADEVMKQFAIETIQNSIFAQKSTNLNSLLQNIKFYFHPTNDAWCRDHGPAFLVNRNTNQKAIVGGVITLGAINIRHMIWTTLFQH